MFKVFLRRLITPFRSLRVMTSREAYAQWAAHYPPRPHNLLMSVEQSALQALIPNLAGLRVLDVACGSGRWGRWAYENGAAYVVGLDNSPQMLARAALDDLVCAEMSMVPLPDACVDVVICGLALGHLPGAAMRSALMEMGRVLRPGGVCLVSDFHPCLAWQGAQRTLQDDRGHTFVVEHYIHRLSDYHAASVEAGLQLTGVREPSPPDYPESTPLVLVLRFQKSPLRSA
ncbi:MAG: class I SAM-dependent methyltransferase [Chloroflexi bacterium]|nr:class I SAM-dependent methyltransferase [Chloroflexota bacterium]